MNRIVSFLSLSLVLACASPTSTDDVDGGGTTLPDASTHPQGLDPAKCTAFAQSFATAAQTCGTPLPAGGQATFEGWCKKGASAAAMCGGDPGAGLNCFASPDPNDWVCQLGEPYPACNGDLSAALGALCVVAMGNPSCATGIKCTYDVDCSDGLACNSRTGQCFGKTAYCIGMPCTYDVDCPSDEKCNSTEHACIGR